MLVSILILLRQPRTGAIGRVHAAPSSSLVVSWRHGGGHDGASLSLLSSFFLLPRGQGVGRHSSITTETAAFVTTVAAGSGRGRTTGMGPTGASAWRTTLTAGATMTTTTTTTGNATHQGAMPKLSFARPISTTSIRNHFGPRPLEHHHHQKNQNKNPQYSFSTTTTTTSGSPGDQDSSPPDRNVVVLDPLVVCGPSGVGKGTIIQRFMMDQDHCERFGFCVSHTTRQPRPGEVNGVHYHFISHAEMQQLLSSSSSSNFFLEWAQVHGNYYGTSWQALQEVQASGRKCLLDIDVQGVQRLQALEQAQQQQQQSSLSSSSLSFRLAPKYVFIAPPSLEALEDRLRQRGTESEEALQRRLRNAAHELEFGLTGETTTTTTEGSSSSSSSSSKSPFHAVIVNHDLDQAVEEFRTLVHTQLYKNGQP
ncbi:hypothetical protein ACA910_018705 [Epithemia clementina (nom. ined.)]